MGPRARTGRRTSPYRIDLGGRCPPARAGLATQRRSELSADFVVRESAGAPRPAGDRMTFQVGDKAYVPNLGVGIVKDIKTIDLDGAGYQMYVIKILENGLTYSVPLSQVGASGIREVIPTSAVEKVYDVLR